MQNLVKKINAVMDELGAVPKTGKNEAQGYRYLAHAEIMKRLHPLLVKNGLIMYPASSEVKTESTQGTDRSGQPKWAYRTIIKTTYVITDGTDKLEFVGIGSGIDSQDKDAYKAQTGAHKYALKGLLTIPDELDAERDEPRHEETSGIKPLTQAQANILEDFRTAGILVARATQKWQIDAPKWLKLTGRAMLSELSEDQARKLIQECEKKVVIKMEEEK
jgi:hypothetical protein